MLHFAGISAGFLIGKADERYGSVVVLLTGGLATTTEGALLAGIL
jgi:hypothetical protein